MSNFSFNTTQFLFWLLAIGSLAAQPSVYQTVKAHRVVTLADTGRPLRTDEKFKATDRLMFSSIKDFVVALDEKNAPFWFLPDASLSKYTVKPLRVPVGTRPGNILNDMQLRRFFAENDSLLLLDGRFSLILGKEAFPMDDKHFFNLEYLWKGDTIRKKLGFRQDTLLIEAKELHKVDSNSINPEEGTSAYFIRYYNEDKQQFVSYPNKTRPICIIHPEDEQLKKEVALLLISLKGQETRIRKLKIDGYLKQFYGTAGDWELDALIKELDEK